MQQPQPPQNPPQPTPEKVYITLSSEINPKVAEAVIAQMVTLANRGVKEVYFLMSTPGGSVMNGINIYNMLRAMPFKLITHNVGNVDSIGNAIFLAGEERYASPHSTFMFHGVGLTSPAGLRLEEKNLREYLGGIEADQKRIGSIIQERTKLLEGEIAQLFLSAQTKDASYAVRAGMVHDIKEANLPSGVPVISLVFNR